MIRWACRGGYAEKSEEVLSNLISGLGVVAFRLIMDELAEARGSAINDGGRQLRGRGDGESPGTHARLDVSCSYPGLGDGPSRPAARSPLLRKTLLISGLRRWKRPKRRKLWAKITAGSSISAVSSSRRPPISSRTSSTAASNRSSLVLEVVVEGTQPHVGGLGDLQDRTLRFPAAMKLWPPMQCCLLVPCAVRCGCLWLSARPSVAPPRGLDHHHS